MKWITREKVKVDRVACPWLIRKSVDRDAEFFFVHAGKVTEESARLGAIPSLYAYCQAMVRKGRPEGMFKQQT